MEPIRKTISLIGAGLTGPLLAILLRQRGFEVDVYERRPDMRRVSINAGRSINLALSTRGIHALRQAGLWEQLQRIIIPMKGRVLHSVSGELTFQPYGKSESDVINSISRADLNIALMNAAEKQGVTFHFNERCVAYDLKSGAITFRNELTNKENTPKTGVVIGCDGSASAIRSEMLKLNRFNFSQQHLDYGYKELTIPAASDGGHQLSTDGLHIWPRGNFMLIALPNIDGTFACILFLPFEGEDSFFNLREPSDVVRFFHSHFPDASRLMPELSENYFANPTGSMVTIKASPWHVEGKALLMGDAAHAIVPFFGQGINCGFEDCASLIELIDQRGTDWPVVFAAFEKARKINTDAIADLAIENFTEMRDKVADPRFLLQKKVELALHSTYPDLFIPRYAMVTFHRIPYSVASARGARQDAMLAELCASIDHVEEIDWRKADELVHRYLTPLEIR